jgi:hypothetical protein
MHDVKYGITVPESGVVPGCNKIEISDLYIG